MSIVVAIIGLLIFLIGLAVLISPTTLRWLRHRHFLKKEWLYAATALRIVIGVLFIIAVPDTRAPTFILVLGIIFIIAGVAIPLSGTERIEQMAEWWLKRSDAILRLWAIVSVILGSAILWCGF